MKHYQEPSSGARAQQWCKNCVALTVVVVLNCAALTVVGVLNCAALTIVAVFLSLSWSLAI
jgi:hypothetical protein